MKKFFIAIIALAFTSCFHTSYHENHNPTTPHDGIFSFEYNGKRFYQYIYLDGCTAHAMCHSNYDTLIISGGVVGKPVERIIFVIPLDKVSSEGRVQLQDHEVVIRTRRDTTESGVHHLYEEYIINGGSADISFNDWIDTTDTTNAEQYITGSFEVDGPIWRGKDLDLKGGLFKFWVRISDHQYRNSKSKSGYNVSIFSDYE